MKTGQNNPKSPESDMDDLNFFTTIKEHMAKKLEYDNGKGFDNYFVQILKQLEKRINQKDKMNKKKQIVKIVNDLGDCMDQLRQIRTDANVKELDKETHNKISKRLYNFFMDNCQQLPKETARIKTYAKIPALWKLIFSDIQNELTKQIMHMKGQDKGKFFKLFEQELENHKEDMMIQQINSQETENTIKTLNSKYEVVPRTTEPILNNSKLFWQQNLMLIQLYDRKGTPFESHNARNNKGPVVININDLMKEEFMFVLKDGIEKIIQQNYKTTEDEDINISLGYSEMTKNDINKALALFYEAIKGKGEYEKDFNDIAKSFQDRGIPLRILIQKKGKAYIEDKEFEKKHIRDIFFIKNTDDKCCLCALLCAYLKQKNEIMIDKFKYTATKDRFECELQQYQPLSAYAKEQNLYTLTKKLYDLIFAHTPYDQMKAITMFEDIYDVEVLVIDDEEPTALKPKKGQLILLLKDAHYNVITNYETYIRTHQRSKLHNYKYCWTHQVWYDVRKQCAKCEDDECDEAYVQMICDQGPDDDYALRHGASETCDEFDGSVITDEEKGDVLAIKKPFFKKGSVKTEIPNFCVYDIESRFENTTIKSTTGHGYLKRHVPWCVCCAFYTYEDGSYQQCKGLKNQFIGDDCCINFLKYVLSPTIQDKKIYLVFAHNGSHYDSILMLDSIKEQNETKIQVIINNGRYLQVKVSHLAGHVMVRDSHSLIPGLRIADMSDKLGLGEKTEKEIQEYDFMSKELLTEFEKYGKTTTINELVKEGKLKFEMYKGIKKDDWDKYLKEHGEEDYVGRYINYCHQDVNILGKALVKIYEEMSNEKAFQDKSGKAIPILNYLTISSFVENIFLLKCGVQDIMEVGYYDLSFNRSKVEERLAQLMTWPDATKYVNELLETKYENIKLIKQNQKFDNYNVDLVIQSGKKKIIVEVCGVYWHGLLLQDENARAGISHYMKKTLEDRLEHHNKKMDYIRAHMVEQGYSDLKCITDKQCEKLFNKYKLKIAVDFDMDTRQGLRGGRTEPFYTNRTLDIKNEIVKGFDFTSLYPSAMLHNIPLGESEVIKGGHKKEIQELINYSKSISHDLPAPQRLKKVIDREDGEKRVIHVLCKLLPPQNLVIPPICTKIEGKLLASLCQKCAEQQCRREKGETWNNKRCHHSKEERKICSWFSDTELILAVHYGYEICEVAESIVYNRTSYNTKRYKGDKFIRQLFYKKTLYSDPDDYTEEDFKILQAQDLTFQYKIGDDGKFIKYEGQNEWKQIQDKPALKFIFKLCLNSLYGRFGMSPCHNTTTFDETVLNKLDIDGIHQNVHLGCIKQVNCGVRMIIQYQLDEELQQLNGSQSNHFIASTITGIGRTCLFFLQEYISHDLGATLLYSDTDSCYCVLNRKQFENVDSFPFEGTLGIKNEVKFKDVYEFVSIGPKAYAYSGFTPLKIKDPKNPQKKIANPAPPLQEPEQTKIKYKTCGKGLTIGDDGSVVLDNGSTQYVFNLYKQMILDDTETFTIKQPNSFLRKPKLNGDDDGHFEIYRDDNMIKTISVNERKRIAMKDGSTLPFGYLVD